jgi:hypothetical protein
MFFRVENILEDSDDVGIFYIDAYEIEYIRSFVSTNGGVTVDRVQLSMVSGRMLEFNLNVPGMSELLQYFYTGVQNNSIQDYGG